jgi:effector-binding domain-containing protein
MVQMQQPTTGAPTSVFGRSAGSVEIQERHPREVAITRVEVAQDAMPQAIGEAIAEVAARMAEAGVELAGPPFARYLRFEPARISAEIGFPVMRPAPHVGRVYPGQLPGGRIASIVHVGSYEALAETYGHLEGWLAEAGTRGTGPMWEVYWTDPESEPDPAAWRTEILVPLD